MTFKISVIAHCFFLAKYYSIVLYIYIYIYIYSKILYTYVYLMSSFICWWTFRLFLYLGYCKLCCYEHWSVCVFSQLEFCLDICLGLGLLDDMILLLVF